MRYMNTRRPELEPHLPVPVARVDHPTMHLRKERVLGHVYVDMASMLIWVWYMLVMVSGRAGLHGAEAADTSANYGLYGSPDPGMRTVSFDSYHDEHCPPIQSAILTAFWSQR